MSTCLPRTWTVSGVRSLVERRRLLVVAPFAPRLDGMNGGSKVMAALLKGLSHDHRIAVIYLRGRAEPVIDPALTSRCDFVIEVMHEWIESRRRPSKAIRLAVGLLSGKPLWVRRWWVPELFERLRDAAVRWRPDIAQFEFHVMAQYASAVDGLQVPRILVQHEPGAPAALERRSQTRGPWWLAAEADYRAWRYFERHATRMFERVVAFTDRDAAALKNLAPGVRIAQIPLGIDVPATPLKEVAAQQPQVLFVGSFHHAPNEDAAVRMATRILPLVQRVQREARLSLVGSAPTPQVLDLRGPAVEVHGSVPDITPYLQQAAVVVAPMRLGGGMRVKVLEALAAGRPLVCSRLAIEGIEVVNEEQVILAGTDQEFANAIAALLSSPERRALLGRRAHAWAAEHVAVSSAVEKYRDLYRSLDRKGMPVTSACRFATCS
jgi:glycosyltransferase involved in cell wall biosynthesis